MATLVGLDITSGAGIGGGSGHGTFMLSFLIKLTTADAMHTHHGVRVGHAAAQQLQAYAH